MSNVNCMSVNKSCQKIPYMNYVDNTLTNTVEGIVAMDASAITRNQDALVFLIFRERYYDKIIKAVESAGNFNKDNKRYYFNFYDYENKTRTKLNSREIWLAKNKIFTFPKLKCNVEYQLYNDRLVNNITNHNKYQSLKCGDGYNFLSDQGFKDYLMRNIYYYVYPDPANCNCEKRDNNNSDQAEEAFNRRAPVYIRFEKIYREAVFYRGILNKINQIKASSLSGKVNNLIVKLPSWIFSGLPSGQRKKLYSGKDAMRIYNSIRNRY